MESILRRVGKRVDDVVYTRLVEWFGGSADAFCKLAQRYESLGWPEQAAAAYRRAILADPEYVIAHRELAALSAQLGRMDDAMKSAECLVALQPTDGLGYFWRGVVFEKQGRSTESLNCYRQAMERRVMDPRALNQIGKAFARAGLYEESVQAYREIIRVAPNNLSAYGVVAATYAKLKRYPEAIDAYRQAVKLRPTADGFAILGSTYAKLGRYREAVEAYQDAVRLEPGLAQTCNRLTEIYIKLDDFEKQAKQRSIDLDTDNSPAASELTHAYRRLRQEQEALEGFKERIKERPDDPRAYLDIGMLYCQMDLPHKAVDFLQHAVRLNPKHPGAHRLLGTAYAAANRLPEAIAAFKKALTNTSADADALGEMGAALLRRGRVDEALQVLRRALKWRPEEPTLLATVADAHRKQGKDIEAAKIYWEAVRRRPQDAELRYKLAMTYVRLGQRDRAMEQVAILRTIDREKANDVQQTIWRSVGAHKREDA